MHWRLQKIMHGFSHFRHALTDRYPATVPGSGIEDLETLAVNTGYSLSAAGEGLSRLSRSGEQFYLRNSGSDALVFREIFLKEEYAALLKLLQMNNIKVRTVADIGANIGLAGRYFLRHLKPGRMLCVEPYGPSFDICNMNLGGRPGVTLVNKAIWSTPVPELNLHRHFRDGQDWSIAATEKQGSLQVGKASAITLGQVLEMEDYSTIDLLKVDIEGGEQEIFSPDADTAFLENVKVVCVELHMEMIGYRKIFETFRRHGFVIMETGGLLLGVRN